MTGSDRIWIDRHGGNWSPVHGGTQDIEYVRRDPAVLAALPEVQAMIAAAYEDAHDAVHYECWTDGDGGGATEILFAEQSTTSLALMAIRNRTPADATAALAKIERDAEARGMVKGMRKAAEAIAKWHLEEGWQLDVDDVPAAILARAAEIEKEAK